MRSMEKEDLYRISFLSELTVSPDQRYLAYVVSKCSEKDNKYIQNIWLYDFKTGTNRQMTTAGDCKNIAFTPDSTSILFTAIRQEEDKKAIADGQSMTVWYSIPVDGGESARLDSIPVNKAMPVPASEGENSVYKGIYDPKSQEKDYELFEELPFWFNGVGYVDRKRTRLFNKEGKALTGEYRNVISAVISPEAPDLVLYAAETYENIMRGTAGIYSLNLKTGEEKTLIPEGSWTIHNLIVSGDRILVLGTNNAEYASTESDDLWQLDTSGRTAALRKVLDLPTGISAAIGSDLRFGTLKSYMTAEGNLYYLETAHTTTRLMCLTASGQNSCVYQGPLTIDGLADRLISLDGMDYLPVCGMTSTCLQEIYLIPAQSEPGSPCTTEQSEPGSLCTTPERLTSHQREYLEEVSIIEPVPVFAPATIPAEQVSSKDFMGGNVIEGFVIPPAGYVAGQKYPAILDIHGGPRSAYGSVPFHEMQYWAGKGYFVFFCNPRGSEGRGDQFADIRGQYGFWDYEDIMTFTDYVLDAYPDIDRTRVAVTGGSYGGYMTNWIVGQTDRFACAAAQRSISNWLTKILTTDIGYLYNMDQHGAIPWEQPEVLWKHSPLKYVKNVKTPLLLFQSDQDYRCWQAEAIQFYTALKYLGAGVRMCLVHGESHGLSRTGRPKQRLIRLTQLTEWFEEKM